MSLLAIFVHVVSCGLQEGRLYPDNVCAISMDVGESGGHELHCFDDLIKALQGAGLPVEDPEDLGWAGIIVPRDQAPTAVRIAKRLAEAEHFSFNDLTDPIVAESLEPKVNHVNPAIWLSFVASALKLGPGAPAPVLLATMDFKERDLPALGGRVYAPIRYMAKATGDMPNQIIWGDRNDAAPEGWPARRRIHSSIYSPAEDAFAELESILSTCRGLPNTVDLADLSATKSTSQKAVLYDANSDFAKRGLTRPILLVTVESGHDSLVAEITSALGSSPFFWYKNDTTGDAPLGWPDSVLVHSSLFVPLGDLGADLLKIKTRLRSDVKGLELYAGHE